MEKISVKVKEKNGIIVRKDVDLCKQLNYNIANLLNKTVLNSYSLPIHHCDPLYYPDYISLCTEPKLYDYTMLTAVGFFVYDCKFDSINGLYNAIYYGDKALLEKYKERYKNVKYVIAPDYSIFDNIWIYENLSRLFKIRIIMLWFVMEIKAVVIPNVIYAPVDQLPLYLSGFEECTVMCFSTKGHIRSSEERNRVKKTVEYVVDNFPLKTILVYSVCGKDKTALKLFSYAISKGIDVRIVDNTMRTRNRLNLKKR